MAIWLYSIEEVAEKLNLKRASKSKRTYVGSCPECGGDDRFRLLEGDKFPIVDTCMHSDNLPRMKRLIELGLVKDFYRGK